MTFRFPKSEKLCGKIRIASLYREGKRFTAFPLRVTYTRIPDSSEPPRVLIWAPKSLFRHAVDRNHMRRLMREAYRLQSADFRVFCAENRCSYHLAFNYMDKILQPQADVSKAMDKALKKIMATGTDTKTEQI